MQPFDLVLTPGWQWHDHGNQTDRPMIWLDGLDIPTVRHFDAGFAERLGEKAHRETALPGDTIARYAHNMRPFPGSLADPRPADQPLFHYHYVQRSEDHTSELPPIMTISYDVFCLKKNNTHTGRHMI